MTAGSPATRVREAGDVLSRPQCDLVGGARPLAGQRDGLRRLRRGRRRRPAPLAPRQQPAPGCAARRLGLRRRLGRQLPRPRRGLGDRLTRLRGGLWRECGRERVGLGRVRRLRAGLPGQLSARPNSPASRLATASCRSAAASARASSETAGLLGGRSLFPLRSAATRSPRAGNPMSTSSAHSVPSSLSAMCHGEEPHQHGADRRQHHQEDEDHEPALVPRHRRCRARRPLDTGHPAATPSRATPTPARHRNTRSGV